MQFFISGTGTDIGKTLVTSWLCAHSNYTYFKPIQTGAIHGTDSQTVAKFSKNKIHKREQ
jgi:dethiobiotin synthetase